VVDAAHERLARVTALRLTDREAFALVWEGSDDGRANMRRDPRGERLKAPRTIVRGIEQGAPLPRGRAERFVGYAVIGLPFASGHVLAMRRFPTSSVGPGYTSIWHRSPEGAWTMWVDVEPLQACPRYFGNGVERVIRAPIGFSWPDSSRMTARIDEGRVLDWEIELDSTLVTRFFSAVGKVTPDILWRRRSVLSAMAAVAGPLLRVGRLSLHGNAPNGQWFKANSKLIWFVTGGRARLCGADLGAFGSLSEPASLGDFLIPQRGIFTIGHAFFEPFAEGRHLAVASREANRESLVPTAGNGRGSS
jgi:hypothetical protein